MGNNLRYIPSDEPTLVAVSNRTVQSRFLLRPSPELTEIIHGALARAQRRYGVEIHGFVFLSNHYHLIVTVYSAQQLSAFVGYFQSKIAKEVCRLYGWSDKVWARRYRHIVLLDEASQYEQFRYLLENSCKEGLVASPLDWPGAHCVKALARGAMEVSGIWFNRTRYWAARQRSREIRMRDFVEPESLRLSAMPIWQHMSRDRYARHVGEMVEQIERKTETGGGHRAPLGANAVLRQDPHGRPRQTKKEPAPFVHASTRAARVAFRSAYNAFVAAYEAAKKRLLATGDSSGFPPGAFLPPLPAPKLDTS